MAKGIKKGEGKRPVGEGKEAAHRRKKRKARMTIIVGIATKEFIAVASDSQTSDSVSSRNRRDTDKIFTLKFKPQGKYQVSPEILVATSGDEKVGLRAVEVLTELTASADLDDYRKPADLAQQAVSQVKKEVAELNHWQPGDPASIKYWQEGTEAALLIAYFYQEKPYLYEVNFWPGIATERRNYVCLGCGGTVAEFILSRLGPATMSGNQAIVSAIYTVEEVKKVDSFCGGPTKLVTLHRSGILRSVGESNVYIKFTLESIAKHDAALKEEWKRIMEIITDEAWKADMESYENGSGQGEVG